MMGQSRRRILVAVLAACLSVAGVAGAFVAPSEALAWDNCPKGLVNDPFPGACRRYVDTNGDGICDLSQPAPTTTTTVAPATTSTTLRQTVSTLAPNLPTVTTSGPPTTGDCPLGPCAGCGACLAGGFASSTDGQDLAADTVLVAAASLTTPPSGSGGSGSGTPSGIDGGSGTGSTSADSSVMSSLFTHYNISPIAIAFFLIYGVSFVLHKTRRIRTATHRKVWNVMLLGTFLITGVFGLILTVQLDYELPFTLPFNLLFWHVEAGVAMTLISLFHVGWHLKYYANLLKRGTRASRTDRELERRESERRRAERDQRRRERELAHRPAVEPVRAVGECLPTPTTGRAGGF